MAKEINGYDLSRMWFNWCFENPEKINPNHTALYFFCIEHCNRLGWKEKFGLPTSMAKEAIGIKSYNTYIKTLLDLVNWGFLKLLEKSKNQFSSNIIALSKNNKAPNNALDKAFIKHASKQRESTSESISSIDKQVNKETIEPINIYREFAHLKISDREVSKLLDDGFTMQQVDDILDKVQNYKDNKKYTSLYLTAKNWLKKDRSENFGQKTKPSKLEGSKEAGEQADQRILEKIKASM